MQKVRAYVNFKVIGRYKCIIKGGKRALQSGSSKDWISIYRFNRNKRLAFTLAARCRYGETVIWLYVLYVILQLPIAFY